MIRALSNASSGMKAQEMNIDVLSNNLANVNTTGFKRSRAEFADLFYEAQSRPGAPSPERVWGLGRALSLAADIPCRRPSVMLRLAEPAPAGGHGPVIRAGRAGPGRRDRGVGAGALPSRPPVGI